MFIEKKPSQKLTYFSIFESKLGWNSNHEISTAKPVDKSVLLSHVQIYSGFAFSDEFWQQSSRVRL